MRSVEEGETTYAKASFMNFPEQVREHYDVVRTEIRFPNILREHLDVALENIKTPVQMMTNNNITKEDVITQLKNTTPGKTPGPDGLKPEFFKKMLESETVLDALSKGLSNTLTQGDVPDNWKKSKTTLIKKKSKPTVEDFRPIALTNAPYKIFMGIIKTKIEEYLQSQEQNN